MSYEFTHSIATAGQGDISFHVNGSTPPVLRLAENGDIFVKGKLIENDKGVIDGLREFLQGNGCYNKSLSPDDRGGPTIEKINGIPVCPEKCRYMTIWESEQHSHPKAPHQCTLHDAKLLHGSLHPRIMRASNCDYVR